MATLLDDVTTDLPRILVVEDEPDIAETLHYALKSDGFDPCCCQNATDALSAFQQKLPALVLLDVGLPDLNGFALFRKLQALPGGRDVPMVFLTARAEEIDHVLGLEMGADDYIAKPFSPRELVARIRNILKRAQTSSTDSTIPPTPPLTPDISNGGFDIDTDKRRARYRGHGLDLSRYEYGLLRVLLARPGRVFSRDELLSAVWDDPAASFDRTVDAHIKTLRAKLRAIDPQRDPIRTVRGAGYALDETIQA